MQVTSSYKEVLLLLVAVLSVTTGYLGLIWWLTRPHFERQVLESLKRNPEIFRAWIATLFADWRSEQVSTAQTTTSTHEAVCRLEKELIEHRGEISKALDGMSRMPAALDHVAQAVASLEKTVVRLDAENREHRTELAILRDRSSRNHPEG